jgi:hypothetical protein
VHSYSAKLLQTQMQDGMFSKLRWFQYQGMRGAKPQAEDNGQPGGFSPMWTRQTGAKSYLAPGNGTQGQTWFNASYGAGWPMSQKGGDHPFFTFSATCIEFARCAFSDRNLHSRMPLVPTRLKRAGVWPMVFLSGGHWHCKLYPNTDRPKPA